MSDDTAKSTNAAPHLTLGNLPASQPHNRRKMRVGRGHGSGKGKTAGRGTKGQKSRTQIRRGFEGGQTPLQRRLPRKRGVSQRALNIGMFRKDYAEMNVGRLAVLFQADQEVTPEVLVARGAVEDIGDGLRVLGNGEIDKPLKVRAHHFTRTAKAKIEAAGGSVELI